MSDDSLPELEIVADVSLDETRRYWLLEHGAPFVFCDNSDIVLPINDVLFRLSLLETWMRTGKIPENVSKPKLSVVKPDGGTDEKR